ncbi:hypothetical protein M758_3G115500 [Ceratodon purpureus]|uniref:Uncharacterized protein n=1 Tax=Ceratodon purpureus TaxID=3225 RepID=A0A8T0IJS9_CERPU|nr:hypothetical protein KC19_3G114300 [Ceratodon purpureus]KAG0622678.1 hypothetical protein M758_3G115500 [Ceratodon purpureus]
MIRASRLSKLRRPHQSPRGAPSSMDASRNARMGSSCAHTPWFPWKSSPTGPEAGSCAARAYHHGRSAETHPKPSKRRTRRLTRRGGRMRSPPRIIELEPRIPKVLPP